MPDSNLPRDPLEAHEVVKRRAEELYERRREQRHNPLPEHAQALVSFVRRVGMQTIQAEVLDVSRDGMRLAAFAHQTIEPDDRCQITVEGSDTLINRWATVRWVEAHPLIRVFGVEFDLNP